MSFLVKMRSRLVAPGAAAFPSAALGTPAPSARLQWLLSDWPLPLIGRLPLRRQVKALVALIGAASAMGLAFLWADLRQANEATVQAQWVGDSLMHSQRLAKAVSNAVDGKPDAFRQLSQSRDALSDNFEGLQGGGRARAVPPLPAALQPAMRELARVWDGTEQAASNVLEQETLLTQLGATLKSVNTLGPRLQDKADQVAALKVQGAAPAREISAAGQMAMLAQRIARQANQLLTDEQLAPELATALTRDTAAFRELMLGLLDGSEALQLSAAREAAARERLESLRSLFTEFARSVNLITSDLSLIQGAKASEARIFVDAETLRRQLSAIQDGLGGGRAGAFEHLPAWCAFLLALAAAVGLAKVHVDDLRRRALDAERQRRDAERLEREAKQMNTQNQAAILQLMNELQEVADGNLTVQATVTEDITGAIADSVNYTIEELRDLVGRINATSELVNDASTKAQHISAGLLSASERQSREIRDTGEAVLAMARQIGEISGSAAESAAVARHSLGVAENGAFAVENAIAGMNDIRDQIQDTAKRIKRLGESSQEIGEIVELISNITEQTNVLALNAAIQAASAGEAGRGFTVVAEEVQRLAERSAEATRQIASLIRTIQADTQDAVAAMERSTTNVVEGTRLSDEAGTALGDIGTVSRQLAELIEGISATASRQAASAGTVAQSIQRILLVTEQTGEGTQQTAASIRRLSELSHDLKSSVSRFKVQ